MSSGDEARRTAVARYQAAMLQIRKQEANMATLQAELREQGRLFRKSEDDIKALQVRRKRGWAWAALGVLGGLDPTH